MDVVQQELYPDLIGPDRGNGMRTCTSNRHAQLFISTRCLMLVWLFIQFYTMCLRATKSLARLCGSTGPSEPSIVEHTIGSCLNLLSSTSLEI